MLSILKHLWDVTYRYHVLEAVVKEQLLGGGAQLQWAVAYCHSTGCKSAFRLHSSVTVSFSVVWESLAVEISQNIYYKLTQLLHAYFLILTVFLFNNELLRGFVAGCLHLLNLSNLMLMDITVTSNEIDELWVLWISIIQNRTAVELHVDCILLNML